MARVDPTTLKLEFNASEWNRLIGLAPPAAEHAVTAGLENRWWRPLRAYTWNLRGADAGDIADALSQLTDWSLVGLQELSFQAPPGEIRLLDRHLLVFGPRKGRWRQTALAVHRTLAPRVRRPLTAGLAAAALIDLHGEADLIAIAAYLPTTGRRDRQRPGNAGGRHRLERRARRADAAAGAGPTGHPVRRRKRQPQPGAADASCGTVGPFVQGGDPGGRAARWAAWLRATGLVPHATWHAPPRATHEAGNTLDGVATRGFRCTSCGVDAAPEAASDHRPAWVDLENGAGRKGKRPPTSRAWQGDRQAFATGAAALEQHACYDDWAAEMLELAAATAAAHGPLGRRRSAGPCGRPAAGRQRRRPRRTAAAS